jgi:hypothetical protein
MPLSPCFFFKNMLEYVDRENIDEIPPKTRGIYVLFNSGEGKVKNVVYVGMARGDESGIRGRLKSHKKNKEDWTHFSAFEVWDNITREQVEELEGLFRHIYQHDETANHFNIQKSYSPFKEIKRNGGLPWL